MSVQAIDNNPRSLLDAAHIAVQSAMGAAERDGRNVSLLVRPGKGADEVAKLLVRDPAGNPAAVMYLSSQAVPTMVASCMSRMAAIRAAVGPQLGQVILTPLAQGEVLGRTFAVVPFCPGPGRSRPARAARRVLLGPLVMRWLHEAVKATRSGPTDEEVEDEVIAPLRHLSGMNEIRPEWRRAARMAIERVEDGRWKPALAIEHGDLWMGNVLLPPDCSRAALLRRLPRPFTLLDWYGGRCRSPGMYDLVRLGLSLRLSPARMKRHVRRHYASAGLNCDESDALSCLAASLGFVAMHLGDFPMEKFARMADRCFRSLAEALDAA